jgi:hypothetical protein
VIFSTACDQLRRGFDVAILRGQRHAFLFNLPATWQTAAANEIFRSELERLGQFLLAIGGRAPTPKMLRQEMLQSGERRTRLLETAAASSPRGFAEAVARFHWDGDFSPPPPAAPTDHIPLALVGGPFLARHWKLLDEIEAAGGRVALNATETGERSLLPLFEVNDSLKEPFDLAQGFGLRWQAKRDTALALDNRTRHTTQKRRRRSALPAQSKLPISEWEAFPDPFEFLVRGYFENIVDVFQRPNTRLYSWLKSRLASRQVRGIVLWHFTGCDLWRAEAQTLRETFGLPVLLLEAGEGPGVAPRELNRLQAFMETLK